MFSTSDISPGKCRHRKVVSRLQPGLFLLGNSMERERAEEGEGAYKEVIIVKANCWIQARQEAVRKWG